MNIPVKVANAIDQSSIQYGIETHDVSVLKARLREEDNSQTQLALSNLLQTDKERALLLTSYNSLINLDAIADFLTVQAVSVSQDTRNELLDAIGITEVPGVPQVWPVRVLVDEALLSATQVYIASGYEGHLLTLDQENFQRLVENCEIANFALPIAQIKPLVTNTDNDIEDIHDSIRKYTSLRIQKQLADTLEIPPLTETARSIIKLSADPNADAEQLVTVVELDPSLSAQVVGWAASPYYSAPGKVTSIHDAIVRVLGFELVLNLAMGLAIGKSLRIPSDQPDGVTPFWRQSVYCALTLEKLNRAVPAKSRGESGLAYLTGLLNNFGYLVLAHTFPAHFSNCCRYLEANRHLRHHHVEQHLLGVIREQICGQLLQTWNLPEEICTAVRFQQDADYSGQHAYYANLCFVGKQLLATHSIGDIPANIISPNIFQRLDLDPQEAENVVLEVLESAEEIDRMTSMFSAQS